MNFRGALLALAILTASGALVHAQDWTKYKGQHFLIYYKKAPLDFVQTVEKAAEEYYRDIATNLGFTRYKGWSWEDRAAIYIYDDSEDYVTAGKQAGWSHGMASPLDKTIRTFPAAHGFFDSTLPHELAHIIFREFVGFKARIPAWFEEGVAMSQEKAKRWGSHDIVQKAIQDGTFKALDELSLIQLRPRTDPELVNLYYAQSASIVNFMISEFGRQHFTRLCRKLKEGGPFEWALAEEYIRYKNLNDLNKAWVRFLENRQ